MKKRFIILLLMVSTMSAGAASAQGSSTGDAVETMPSGLINWTVGEVRATGIGAPPAQPVNAAQARAMAQRAAFVVALRNLLETVKGVRVDSESVVENFMVKSDTIRTRVDGIVKGARIVNTHYLTDGSVEVEVAMPLRGALMDAIVPQSFGSTVSPPPIMPLSAPQKPVVPAKPLDRPRKTEPVVPAPSGPVIPEKKPEPTVPQPPPAEVKKPTPPASTQTPAPAPPTPQGGQPTVVFKGGKATGLVIDGRGLGLRPALLPRIIDSQGQEVYVGKVVSRTNSVEQGVAGYARDVNAATNNFRVTDNPAVIRGIRASSAARTDIIIGQSDALMLRQLGNTGDFLQYCRVIIVY